MLAAHRIRLAPNNAQATYLARAAGTARFAYNWALAEWQKQSLARQNNPALPAPSQLSLRRQLNAVKRDQFPWMLEVTKNAPQMAIIQLGQAFENFFSKRARYPRFRRKGRDDRFSLSNDQFAVEGQRIRIPKLGWVRMREALRFTGRIVSATIARRAGHWYASLTVDTLEDQPLPTAENQGALGSTWEYRRWRRYQQARSGPARRRFAPCLHGCAACRGRCRAKSRGRATGARPRTGWPACTPGSRTSAPISCTSSPQASRAASIPSGSRT